MSMELIGASLDDFSNYLFFIVNNNQLEYVSFSRLGITVQGWGDISWSLDNKNRMYYTATDHNLYESELFIRYDDEADKLIICLNEERNGYDPDEISNASYLESFEPGEDVTHFARETYEVTEISKKTLPVTDNVLQFKGKTVDLIKKWSNLYNI